MDKQEFSKRLRAWFRRHGRDLPWRRTRDPYAILVSEMMLQQTTVAAVLPYYERWMKRFPSVQALAAAEESEVLALWQGLGYYRRARNLHAAATRAGKEMGGVFPRDYDSLRALPGVGDYTAQAVRAEGMCKLNKFSTNEDKDLRRAIITYPVMSADVLSRKHIVMVRHGQSQGQAWRELGLESRNDPMLLDAHLTKEGHREAQHTGKALRDKGFLPELVICSPLTRALQVFVRNSNPLSNIKINHTQLLRCIFLLSVF